MAETVTVAAGRDTTIYSDNPSWSNGAGQYLFTGTNNKKGQRRALMAFNVGAFVPPGSTISTVALRLYVSRTKLGSSRIALHRLTSNWNEASSNAGANEGAGAPAAEGDATWSHRVWPGMKWSKDGGDFATTPSAAATVVEAGVSYEWSDAAMVADVQRWLDDPASGFGWILIADDADAGIAKRFGAHEGSRAQAPQLVVTFTPPANPIGACCGVDGSCGYALDPGAMCAGMYRGQGSACAPGICPPPVAACCLPNASAACEMRTEAACGSENGRWIEEHPSCDHGPCPVVLTPFVDPLPLPAAATPTEASATGSRFRMAMVQTKQKLHRDLPPTTVWGFDDGVQGPGYPGPTIEARSGVPVTVTWVNDLRGPSGTLRSTHALPVDPCPHGAATNTPRTVVHLHGGHVPSAFDGQPELTLLPGEETTYEYPNLQGAATLWYHDHALGITRLNVIMGLAGFYILRDDQEDALGLPSGKYDVPLAIQDRSFHPDGRFKYPETLEEHFFGDTILVNGKVWPYFEVDRGRYRFRLLNGSTSRTYKLAFAPFLPMVQIGTDGGLLRSGIAQSTITIAPGERAEAIVNFGQAGAAGEYVLTNEAPSPFPNGDEQHAVAAVMKFVLTAEPGHLVPPPVYLRQIERLDPESAAVTRDFSLERFSEGCGGASWRINNLGWHDITEKPRLGTSEIWRFINRSGVAHPMHLHLVMFQVLDRQPFVLEDEKVLPTGDALPPDPGEDGWKDTVQVGPFEIVRVIARFEDYVGKFPYHCHILEHEDHEMMRQFETLPSCGDAGCPDGPDSRATGGGGGCGCQIPSSGSSPRFAAGAAAVALWFVARRGRRRKPGLIRSC